MKRLIFCIYMFVVGLLHSQNNLTPQPYPCLQINSQNTNGLSGNFYNDNCIHIGEQQTPTNIPLNGNLQLNLQSGKEITIQNTGLKVQGNSKMHLFIEKENIESVWYSPNSTAGMVGKYNRLELGFKLPSNVNDQVTNFLNNTSAGLNPFDPEQIDLRVLLTPPSGQEITRYAFYYQPFNALLNGSSADPANIVNEWEQDTTSFPWRFRFAPDELGVWSVRIELYINGILAFEQLNSSFECVPSDHKGNLMVSNNGDESDRWLYYKETGETFFAVGMNISNGGFCTYLPSQNLRQLQGIQNLIDVQGNITRLELSPQGPLPDWDKYNNYSSKEDEMYGFDKIIELCEANGVYFSLFRHHIEMDEGDAWAGSGWSNNSYNLDLMATLEQYFLDLNVAKWQNNCIRYIYSRWGYSKNLVYYGYSETDLWHQPFQNGGNHEEWYAAQTFKNWAANQQNYIKNNFKPEALFAHSNKGFNTDILFNPNYSIFSISDIIAIHSYGQSKQFNAENRKERVELLCTEFTKPVLIEEMGIGSDLIDMNCCTGIEFHNALWATAMMGGIGSGMEWWWDRGVMDNNYHFGIKPLNQFFSEENLRQEKYLPQSWNDNPLTSLRKFENFCLVSANKERVLGWFHNSTYYWRNLAETNSCINNLVEGDVSESGSCHVAQDTYGVPYEIFDWGGCLVRPFYDMYSSIEGFENLGNEYNDFYTNTTGGATNFAEMNFKIKKLKKSGLFKKQWYRLQFYYTHTTNLTPVFITDDVHTNSLGTLNVDDLNAGGLFFAMAGDRGDCAYKLTYLGNYKNKIEDKYVVATITPEEKYNDSEFKIEIYPNPNYGEFTIEASEVMNSIEILNNYGQKIVEFKILDLTYFKINYQFSKGVYFLKIQTNNQVIHLKKMVVYE